LREGGSLPAIVEADDSGLYVLKFRGAGQGPLALVAELISGEIGRALGLRIPEIVFADLDEAIGRNEPDPEIRELLLKSVGINLALDYLPGSLMFDVAAKNAVDPRVASQTVWFDAFVTNIDRTAHNPNLLWWHKTLYLIDHGASLYFQHDWKNIEEKALSPFQAVRNHVLLRWATDLRSADDEFRAALKGDVLERIVAEVPDEWLTGVNREGYLTFLNSRLAHSNIFLEEALRARAL
jgi:hypothetical protein